MISNYIRSVIENPNNQIIINGPGVTLMGHVEADTVFAANADYGQLSSSSALDSISTGVQLTSEYTDLVDAGETFKLPKLTRLSWQGSSFGALSFGLYFIALHDGENVMDKVRQVWKMVLPEKEDIRYKTPLDYNANQQGDKTENHLSVKIGNWFDADGFVMNSAVLTVSKEKIDASGRLPLYVRLDVTLMPTEGYTATVVGGWFA